MFLLCELACSPEVNAPSEILLSLGTDFFYLSWSDSQSNMKSWTIVTVLKTAFLSGPFLSPQNACPALPAVCAPVACKSQYFYPQSEKTKFLPVCGVTSDMWGFGTFSIMCYSLAVTGLLKLLGVSVLLGLPSLTHMPPLHGTRNPIFHQIVKSLNRADQVLTCWALTELSFSRDVSKVDNMAERGDAGTTVLKRSFWSF